MEMRVTGIGGIFFKADDPKKLLAWYEKHLGLKRNPMAASTSTGGKPAGTSREE